MIKNTASQMICVLFAVACSGPVLADNDPTLPQVYEAARTGHMGQAQQMMNQVLRDHPNSAKAHYVAAELYAKAGNLPVARQELNTAQGLEPGLPFARAEAVRELQRELSQGPLMPRSSQAPASFPWGMLLVVVAGAAILWAVLRRRSAPANISPQYPGTMPAAAGLPGNPGAGGVAASVGGAGSGIVGGLASGLAVGAGVVAGEELARHFLDSERHEGHVPPAASDGVGAPENNDLGGSDFGVSEADSWDDGSAGIGGDVGGDDWT